MGSGFGQVSPGSRGAATALAEDQRDDGFTLIELLMVIAILPLVIGAIAAAVLVSLDNQTKVSNRLSDLL